MWSKNANLPNEDQTWQGALDYVKSMNSGSGLGGYHDWRLSNRKELFSLIDHSKLGPALPASHPFQNVQSYSYWSSTTSLAFDTFIACVVHMWNGFVDYCNKSGYIYVWPVRSGQGPVAETVSIPNILTGPISGATGTSYSYTTGGSISNFGHSVEYQFDWTGDGSDLSPWGSTTQSKTWTVAGTYTVKARARCATHSSVISGWTSGLSVTISGLTETVSTPNPPSGPASGVTDTSYSYSTGGSISNLGHTVEYQFDWKGDGSDLSAWGSGTQSKGWTVPGTYNVQARARCTIDTSVISSWSGAIAVTITTGGNGVINLPQTGQTKCYNSLGAEINCAGTGQDGESQVGVEWPEPRFTVSDDCVTDNLTGLMWAKTGNLPDGTKTWQGALVYVASINYGSGLCGHKDWRLPNVNELESLINSGEANTANWLNNQGFNNVQADFYWSSTTYAYYTDFAWIVSMWDGYVFFSYKSSYYYVWPVRSGQSGTLVPSEIWKTGQTTSYASGDDGDLEKGVSWPAPRFIDHDDETITDNLTGLMWAKNANLPNGEKTWQGALDYVKSINNGTGLGGHYDWRLPNRKELFSLIDRSRNSPALPSDSTFQNVQAGYYWSSTTYASNTDVAWVVSMWSGVVNNNNKSFDVYVWPVRSGQGPLGYPDISVTPNPVPFGNVNVGGTSDQTVTIKNDGNANLVVGTITQPTQPFSKYNDNCSGQTIAPNSTCTVTYRFAPTTSGSFSSSSNIPSNDPDENPAIVSLNGVGVVETVSIPNILTGPVSGTTGVAYSYTTGGSTSNFGHSVEYQFDWKGDGTDLSSWGSATQSKIWTSAGTYTVKARARCATHTSVISGWSTGLSVTISTTGVYIATRDLPDCYIPSVPLSVTITVTPSATTNNYGVVETPPNGWTISEINENGWWDNEFYNWVRWYFRDKNNRTLTYKTTPPFGETGSKTFLGWAIFDEDVVTIGGDSTIEKCPPETVSIPNVPSGPTSGSSGISYSYTTGGSTSNLGHSLEYQFDWKGDGTDLSPWGSATQSKIWTSAGTYNVRARARCATDTLVVSGWSSGLSVTIVGGGIATRDLPDCYISFPLSVTITVTPGGTTSSYAVEDSPPSGWTVSNINENGQWDDANKKVKWGPFFDHNARTLTYQATPPVVETETKMFSGSASFDGMSVVVGGDSAIGVCSFHPAETNYDYRIGMNEVTAYGSAWKTGQNWPTPPNPIPVEYVTNAVYLWKMGEVYHYDGSASPPWVPGAASIHALTSQTTLQIPIGLGTGSATRTLPSTYEPSVVVSVSISVNPGQGTQGYAVEETPPNGWGVSDINESGQWDSVNKKVKWGPFFDANNRTLTYKAAPPVGETGTKTFSGTASFDGTNVTISGSSSILRKGAAIPDFNGDGRADILWRNKTTGQNVVWFMNGTTYSNYAEFMQVTDTNWQIVGTGDFNNDGKTDVLWRNTSTGQNVVWLMDGVNYGGYAWLLEVADLNWEIVGTGDFNGDGKTDILWRNKGTGQNVVWFMDGATYSSYAELMQVADANWEIVGTGDFNGDGKTDILWRNKSTGQNMVWYMNGAVYSSYAELMQVTDTNWQIVGTGDFNNDGKVDILWRNKSTGQNEVWFMNGAAFSSYSLIDTVADTNWEIVGPK